MRALIVDDNLSMRTMLSALLASQGYEVVASLEDGSQVMQVIAGKLPQLVCLDYQMPGRDGLGILSEINEKHPEIDVLFMTASEDESVQQKAADAGAAGFLRKPFGQGQVIEELTQVKAMREQVMQQHTAKVPPPAAANPQQRTAVIADDNASIRFLMKGLLESCGVKVLRSVSNGQEAIAAVRELQPRILCLDVDMPVMTGLEALPLIRQVSPLTAVVMVTGRATREFVEKASALGAKGYVVKPVRPAYIETFMKKLLS